MIKPYPYDIRQARLSSEAEVFRYLYDVHYANEERTYLSWIEPSLCREIRGFIASACSVPINSVLIVGSARLGFSTKNDLPFEMGFSDLDIAVFHSGCVESLLGRYQSLAELAENSFIRPDRHLDHPFCAVTLAAAKEASEVWSNKFSAISIAIYSSLDSVVMRTAAAVGRWRQLLSVASGGRALAAYRLQSDQLDKVAASGFRVFQGSVDDSSPVVSGPFVVSYDVMRNTVGAMGNREDLLRNLDCLLYELKKYINIGALMIGGSVLISSVKKPKDIDCAIFYSHIEGGEYNKNIENAMKWIRRYRQKGIDLRIFPDDGPKWITIKLAGYMTALFSESRNRQSHGPIIVTCD